MAGLVVKPIDALSEEQLAHVQVIYAGAQPDLRVPFRELTRHGDADQTFVAMEGNAPAGFAALRRLGSVNGHFCAISPSLAIAAATASAADSGNSCTSRWGSKPGPGASSSKWNTRSTQPVMMPAGIRERRIASDSMRSAPAPASGYVLPDYTASGRTKPFAHGSNPG